MSKLPGVFRSGKRSHRIRSLECHPSSFNHIGNTSTKHPWPAIPASYVSLLECNDFMETLP